MGDEEAIFDPLLKKKKKKKTGFNLDQALADNSGVPADTTPVAVENGNSTEPKEDVEIDDMEMFGKKKSKKKKKTAFLMDDLSDALNDGLDGVGFDGDGDGGMNIGTIVQEREELDLDMDFSKTKKKKSKKKYGLEDLIGDDENQHDTDNKENGDGWLDSDRDYVYDELLQRAFNQLCERNPDMATGEKKKFIMKPPQVVRIGSKKTAFANFSEICRLMHRLPKHLLQFLLAELGTSGSIDGNNQLIIKGRFQQKQIENVLRRYIKEYVTCHTCRSPDTILQKDARLYFLQCEQCNSRCSVAPIKSGFQAVANKQQRQAIRAGKD